MKTYFSKFVLLSLLSSFSICHIASSQQKEAYKFNHCIYWEIKDLIHDINYCQIEGSPIITDCPYGKAVSFNGMNDGIFIDTLPTYGLTKMTIEVIFKPCSGGSFEQRFLHIGEIKGNRILLELRSLEDNWYLDAFVNSNSVKKVLVNPALKHPLDKWYHIAFVIDGNNLYTYVNHIKELEDTFHYEPINKGKTSIGVRQNKVSWFTGTIYKIKISPYCVKTEDFLSFN